MCVCVCMSCVAILQGKSAQDIVIPCFNAMDCPPEIQLSCGGHCATKVHPGLYRTVRTNTAVPLNRAIYFEMSVAMPSSRSMIHKNSHVPHIHTHTDKHNHPHPYHPPSNLNHRLITACIGLSSGRRNIR
jgi:hypothetical protein